MENQHRKIGYRELEQKEIDTINNIKELDKAIEYFIESMPSGVDKRWLAIGKTHLQEGFMALTRSVAG